MLNSDDFNFSFSGLKTAVLYLTRDSQEVLQNKIFISEICHEFQQAAIDVLVKKTLKAARKFAPRTIMISGGVSANKELRHQLGKMIEEKLPGVFYLMPDKAYSIDNATMIAAAAYWRYTLAPDKKIYKDQWKNLKTSANLKLHENK